MNKFRDFNKVVLVTVLCAFISITSFSCAVAREKKVLNKKLTQCVKPKPQICTLDSNPVCGFESDGNHKTFSNACTACSSNEVINYDNGACK